MTFSEISKAQKIPPYILNKFKKAYKEDSNEKINKTPYSENFDFM